MTTNNPKINKRNKRFGLPPGSLVYIGHYNTQNAGLQLIQYDDDKTETFIEKDVDVLLKKVAPSKRNWLNVTGINHVENIKEIGNFLNIDLMTLEDILDTSQRPKYEVYNDYLFFTLKIVYPENDKTTSRFHEQLSIILTKNLVITFLEKETTCFDDIYERLNLKDNLLRKQPSDYLFYRLLDTVVDHYYMSLESFEENIEALELRINNKAREQDLKDVQHLKRKLVFLRRSVYPLREAILSVQKENPLLSKSTNKYMSDVYDHTVHIIETIETYRDITSGLMDLYKTGISNKTNEIMKVLTVISTIFIPLSFITGVYGMNFKYMPELEMKWAYPVTIFVMLVIAVIMIIYFKRKKWM